MELLLAFPVVLVLCFVGSWLCGTLRDKAVERAWEKDFEEADLKGWDIGEIPGEIHDDYPIIRENPLEVLNAVERSPVNGSNVRRGHGHEN